METPYATNDLYEAAYLYTKNELTRENESGFSYIKSRRMGKVNTTFYFENPDRQESFSKDLQTGIATVNLATYLENLEHLKDIIFQ